MGRLYVYDGKTMKTTNLKLWFPELNSIQHHMLDRIILEARLEELKAIPLESLSEKAAETIKKRMEAIEDQI